MPGRLTLKAGAEPIPGYQLVRQLGQGSFGSVWLADCKEGHRALKCSWLEHMALAWRPAAIQFVRRRAAHPHLLVPLGLWFLDEGGGFVPDPVWPRPKSKDAQAFWVIQACEVMDNSVHGHQVEVTNSLAGKIHGDDSQLHPLPLAEVLTIVGQVAAALDYLHEQGLIHGNVTPHQIMLRNGEAYLADLELAVPLGETWNHARGCAGYVSFEWLNGRPTFACDQYSLAITIFELLTGHWPFSEQNSAATYFAKSEGKYRFDRIGKRGLRQVLAKATARKADARFKSCQEFALALKAAGNRPTFGSWASSTLKSLFGGNRTPDNS